MPWGACPAADREAGRLSDVDDAVLRLAARLPLAPIPVLQPLTTLSRAALYASVERLSDRGLLVRLGAPPHGGGRRPHLLLPSNLGFAVLALRGQLDSTRRWGRGRALVAQLPTLLGLYELLRAVAEAGQVRPRLRQWAQPWAFKAPPSAAGRLGRTMHLPSVAVLEWALPDARCASEAFILVADRGGLSPAALRVQFAALARLACADQQHVPAIVVVATTSERRVLAWRAMSELATRRYPGRLLKVDVATWADWEARAKARTARTDTTNASPPLASRCAEDTRVPRLDLGVVERGVRRWDLDPGERAVLDVVGRHPFVSTAGVVDVLGAEAGWVRRRAARLIRRGLATRIAANEVPSKFRSRGPRLELTRDGLEVLAGYLGLPLASAVRYHGLAGGGAAAPVGSRRALLRNLHHTLGADEVFAAMAKAIRRSPGAALLEWQNATACGQGRVRPDGYGLIRLGRREYGFFVEFDRGTVRPSALRAKFAAYVRYRASERAAREYDGFPSLLVVSEHPGGERRAMEALWAVVASQLEPAVFFTTAALLAQGFSHAIWRRVGTAHHCRWPES
jgi:Replication-relaxation